MYKVIGKTNTRAMRVLWAMHEIGLEFNHIKVATQSAEAQKANISGKVPRLILNDIIITDYTAIITYLDDK